MAISYNSTSVQAEIVAGATTLTWSHTCDAADTKLVVACGARATVTGVTYNGVAMTIISSETSNYMKSYGYYLDDPATDSAHNIVVTYSGSATYRLGTAFGASGCDAGIGIVGVMPFEFSTNDVSITVTTEQANSDVILLGGTNNANTPTPGTDQTLIVKSADAQNWRYDSSWKPTTAAGSYTVTEDTGVGNCNKSGIAVELFTTVVASTARFLSLLGVGS